METAVFAAEDALRLSASGGRPVLILEESRPEDLSGLLASVAVVTRGGGWTSHAAVVARGLGIPAVTALTDASVDIGGRLLRSGAQAVLAEGDLLTVDGTAGVLYLGAVAAGPEPESADELRGWLLSVLDASTGKSTRLAVRANVDSAADAYRAKQWGASGVGLCRIEHMFLGPRKTLLARVLTARPGPELTEGLSTLRAILVAELRDLLFAMDGLPVTIRLIDLPRHEFLPDLAELSASAALDPEQYGDALQLASQLDKHDPMLGVRGVRLALLMPALAVAQMESLVIAVQGLRTAGRRPQPELLVPMVSTPAEVTAVRDLLAGVCTRFGTSPEELGLRLGAMVETPRAALTGDELAKVTDFLSLGTNDLTSLTWGLSRDDAERQVLPLYRELGLVRDSPFRKLDLEGVGTLIRRVVADARAVNPVLRIGVCGEQATGVQAMEFFKEIGADYVSCSAARLVSARFAAATAPGPAPSMKGMRTHERIRHRG
jgi:pyruvate, orthophosphate dikinase